MNLYFASSVVYGLFVCQNPTAYKMFILCNFSKVFKQRLSTLFPLVSYTKSPMYYCVDELKSDFRDLRRKEAEIRLQLRTNGGHGGKVSQETLIWLDDVKRMEYQMNRVNRLKAEKPVIEARFCACYSLLKVHRAEVKLLREVKSLFEQASSLLVSHGNNAIDRVGEQSVSPALVGKSAQSILKQVCDYLADPKIGIIGLYGEGGVGKTTIMKNVNNFSMNANLFDKIFWVTMSQGATIHSVQNQIALQLGITLPSSAHSWTRAGLISHNLKNLGRCLFLLDDMWLDMWDGLPKVEMYFNRVWDDGLLSRIGIQKKTTESSFSYSVVLTTRSRQVCGQIGAHKNILVSPLSENEAWDLFVSKTGNHVLDSEIRNIAEQIVYKCQGLPITVITIAYAMREEVSTITWRRVLEDLRNTNNVDVDKRISDLLRVGYSHLKNERVQKCFLYCAFFPEDFQFEARELIQYWIVEELICKESIVASIDEGYQILKEITDANMLEPVMIGGDAWVRMHDLFRDLAVNIMTQELGFLVQAGQRLRELDDQLKNKKKASLIRNQIIDLHFRDWRFASDDLSTLLLRENPLSYLTKRTFFDQLRNLQVLDMSYSGIIELPNSVCHLSKLRALFLQYCTSLEILHSLEYCKELQFLNLRGTLIKKLPPGMENLIKLKSLDLSETIRLENIQEGLISSLYNLEELQMQGSLLCKLESPTIASRLKEIRFLEKLAILTLSAIGVEDHLDTILHLQGHSLTSFSINVYGSAQDYNEDV